MISVIIPTYNRLKNLRIVLAALEAQEDASKFEVVISDDGSTDGTRQYCKDYVSSPEYALGLSKFTLNYIWCGPHIGFRPHRTRNLGIANAAGDWAVFIDSDIVLNKHALNEHEKLRKEHPGVVVVGMYHFTDSTFKPELVEGILKTELTQTVYDEYVPKDKSKGPPAPGIDCRINGFTDDMNNIITEYDGLGFFGGNISWSIELWWKLGGMDELMPSGMGEDAEMGQRMRVNNIPVIQYKPVWGVHLHHSRDWEESRKLVAQSIHYIDKKYSIGTYAKTDSPKDDPRSKDSSVWYTKESGAILVRCRNNPTVYAVNQTKEFYVGIPSPTWLELLEFTFDDVAVVEDEFLKTMLYKGTIRK